MAARVKSIFLIFSGSKGRGNVRPQLHFFFALARRLLKCPRFTIGDEDCLRQWDEEEIGSETYCTPAI